MVLRALGAARHIEARLWDTCAGAENPFLSHAFFTAVEDSGSASPETGWQPHHLGLFQDERLVGIVPLYLKGHSQGEFVFDYSWAHAYQRAGGAYYPKLFVGVPFSPVPGPRLLLGPDGPPAEQVLRALTRYTDEMGLSSLHIAYCPQSTYEMGQEPWLQRLGLQFHWHNRGYASFQEFLDGLAARKRKAIRKEREAVRDSGLELLTLSGDQLEEEHWSAFFALYWETCSRKWGGPYLSRQFFTLLHQRMAGQVVLMLARDQGRYVAGAFNLLGPGCLFGRNWGCRGHYPFLHFELCYYQAIEFAIAHGLARVEAGVQGLHKVARGYEPVRTYSLHYLSDPSFRQLLKEHLQREREATDEDLEEVAQRTPFKQT